jgi:L-ascorbate metabolism protein UlaG (beta-lactamase superfamily)
MNFKGIQLTWLGHATFRMVTPAARTVIIDPWIMNNPMCREERRLSSPCSRKQGNWRRESNSLP